MGNDPEQSASPRRKTRLTLQFDYYTSTPGTYRYKERAAKGAEYVGALYLKNRAFAGEPAELISVTITF